MSLPASFFAAAEVQAREVELPDGSKHTLHFRELPAMEFRKFHIAETSDNEEIKASSIAKLITASLVNEDGKPAITYAQAQQLKGSAANALMTAILDVNGFGKKND